MILKNWKDITLDKTVEELRRESLTEDATLPEVHKWSLGEGYRRPFNKYGYDPNYKPMTDTTSDFVSTLKFNEKTETKSKRKLEEGVGAGYKLTFYDLMITDIRITDVKKESDHQVFEFEGDIIPGEYDWEAEHPYWWFSSKEQYLNDDFNVQPTWIDGGTMKGTADFYDHWPEGGDWTEEEVLDYLADEEYTISVIYGGGWLHSWLKTPLKLEDGGNSINDDNSGSWITSASLDIHTCLDRMNNVIYYAMNPEEEEEEEDEDIERDYESLSMKKVAEKRDRRLKESSERKYAICFKSDSDSPWALSSGYVGTNDNYSSLLDMIEAEGPETLFDSEEDAQFLIDSDPLIQEYIKDGDEYTVEDVTEDYEDIMNDEDYDLHLATDDRQAGQWYESRRHPDPDKWKKGDCVIYKGKRYATSLFMGGDMVKLENHEGSIVVPQSEVYKATKKDINESKKSDKSRLKEYSGEISEKDIQEAYNHYVKDLGKIPSVDDVLETMETWNRDYLEYWDTPQNISKLYRAINDYLIREGLDFLDESNKSDKSRLREGTWEIPDTVEKAQAILDLMQKPLSSKEAVEEMYDLYGDDRLFDNFFGNKKDVRRYIRDAIYDLVFDIKNNPNSWRRGSTPIVWDPEVVDILEKVALFDTYKVPDPHWIESKKIKEAEEEEKYREIPLRDEKVANIVSSVLGQMSDGYWENSSAYDKYWRFASVEGNTLYVSENRYDQESYPVVKWNRGNHYTIRKTIWHQNGLIDKSDEEIKKFFAQKAKFLIKEEGLEWSRDNQKKSEWMSWPLDLTAADVYSAYDWLMGRKDRKVQEKTVDKKSEKLYNESVKVGKTNMKEEKTRSVWKDYPHGVSKYTKYEGDNEISSKFSLPYGFRTDRPDQEDWEKDLRYKAFIDYEKEASDWLNQNADAWLDSETAYNKSKDEYESKVSSLRSKAYLTEEMQKLYAELKKARHYRDYAYNNGWKKTAKQQEDKVKDIQSQISKLEDDYVKANLDIEKPGEHVDTYYNDFMNMYNKHMAKVNSDIEARKAQFASAAEGKELFSGRDKNNDHHFYYKNGDKYRQIGSRKYTHQPFAYRGIYDYYELPDATQEFDDYDEQDINLLKPVAGWNTTVHTGTLDSTD